MQDPNQKRTATPEQLLQARVDETSQLTNHIWTQVLPMMEQNFIQALSTAFLQNNAIMTALRDKGILTDEDMLKATEKARAEMEKKQKEAQDARAQQAKNAEESKGPKIISPNDLEGLQDSQESVEETPAQPVPEQDKPVDPTPDQGTSQETQGG